MIVRWGLDELPGRLRELEIERPFLIASDRWSGLDLPAAARWNEVPTDRIDDIAEAAEGSDGILAVGGGSAIDLGKAVSAESGLPLVSVPTTYAGAALAGSMLALAHAMAQAVGGRYGLPHGALNAICLPPALRFNEPVAGAEIARFAEALGTADAIARVQELARLGGFARLRDLGVPEEDLDELGYAASQRGGALANPRPAEPAEVAKLLRSVW